MPYSCRHVPKCKYSKTLIVDGTIRYKVEIKVEKAVDLCAIYDRYNAPTSNSCENEYSSSLSWRQNYASGRAGGLFIARAKCTCGDGFYRYEGHGRLENNEEFDQDRCLPITEECNGQRSCKCMSWWCNQDKGLGTYMFTCYSQDWKSGGYLLETKVFRKGACKHVWLGHNCIDSEFNHSDDQSSDAQCV